MPAELNFSQIDLGKSTGTAARVFQRALGLLKRDRHRISISIEKELIEAYEKKHPRTINGQFQGANFSDDVNRGLALWMLINKYID